MADKNKTSKTEIDSELVRQLAGLLEETGLSEIEYGSGDWHLRVSKGGVAVAPAVISPPALSTAPVPSAAADGNDDHHHHVEHPGVIISPMVGTVYTTSEPDDPPFVKVGDQVSVGDTLVLIEAMKVFNPVKAVRSGTVSRIFVNNATPVEFGEPLMIIE